MNKTIIRISNTLCVAGLLIISYGVILSTNASAVPDKMNPLYLYGFAGFTTVAVALALWAKPHLGMLLLRIFYWMTLAYVIYISCAFSLIFANPFFILGALANPVRLVGYVSQLGFVISLFVYSVAASRVLSKFARVRDGQDVVQKGTSDRVARFSVFSLVVFACLIALTVVPSAAKEKLAIIDPSRGNAGRMEKYLSDKYKEKFLLSDFKTSKSWSSSFTYSLTLTATARPVNNQAIDFTVSGCIEKCKASDIFSDDYVRRYWSNEEKPAIEAELRSIFGELPKYKLTVGLPYNQQREFTGRPPSFRTIKESTSLSPYIHVNTYQPGIFSTQNIPEAERRTRAFAQYLNNYGVKEFSFIYTMEDPNPVPETVYRPLPSTNVKQSDVHCDESISITTKTYASAMQTSSLKESYSKGCGYEAETGSGGSVVRGTYPG